VVPPATQGRRALDGCTLHDALLPARRHPARNGRRDG
jgi:hypothetical protein